MKQVGAWAAVFVALLCGAMVVGVAAESSNFRPPKGDADLRYWLDNMVWHHRFTPDEVRNATGMTLDAIEEALGNLVGAGFKPETLLDELGTRWEITRNYFRLYACCNPVHPSLDCVKAALAAAPVRRCFSGACRA